MIRVRTFSEQDFCFLRKMNPEMAEEIRGFSEVIPESIVSAEADGTFLGAAYLTACSSFRHPQCGDGRRFVRGTFRALPGSPLEIEASEALLHAMQESVRRLQQEDPAHRIILQLYRNAESLLSTEFLMDCGFFPQHLMLAMERDLWEDAEEADDVSRIFLPESGSDEDTAAESGSEFLITLHTDPGEDDFLRQYEALSAEAFGGMPDSIAELRYRMRAGARVYAAEEDGKLIATVTVMKDSDRCAATENIFCRASYRRRGITAAMLRKVLWILREEGYEKARLTLFSDNLPAWNLYRKLGYELSENIIEYHYETSPKLRGF